MKTLWFFALGLCLGVIGTFSLIIPTNESFIFGFMTGMMVGILSFMALVILISLVMDFAKTGNKRVKRKKQVFGEYGRDTGDPADFWKYGRKPPWEFNND